MTPPLPPLQASAPTIRFHATETVSVSASPPILEASAPPFLRARAFPTDADWRPVPLASPPAPPPPHPAASQADFLRSLPPPRPVVPTLPLPASAPMPLTALLAGHGRLALASLDFTATTLEGVLAGLWRRGGNGGSSAAATRMESRGGEAAMLMLPDAAATATVYAVRDALFPRLSADAPPAAGGRGGLGDVDDADTRAPLAQLENVAQALGLLGSLCGRISSSYAAAAAAAAAAAPAPSIGASSSRASRLSAGPLPSQRDAEPPARRLAGRPEAALPPLPTPYANRHRRGATLGSVPAHAALPSSEGGGDGGGSAAAAETSSARSTPAWDGGAGGGLEAAAAVAMLAQLPRYLSILQQAAVDAREDLGGATASLSAEADALVAVNGQLVDALAAALAAQRAAEAGRVRETARAAALERALWAAQARTEAAAVAAAAASSAALPPPQATGSIARGLPESAELGPADAASRASLLVPRANHREAAPPAWTRAANLWRAVLVWLGSSSSPAGLWQAALAVAVSALALLAAIALG